MKNPKGGRKSEWWQVALFVVLIPVLIVVTALAFLLFLLTTTFLHITIWTWWCLRGRDILFVYSDSPLWHDYIEARILPRLGDRAVILNWSDRARWRISVARLAFHHFGGSRQFNPLAVVFRPFHRSRMFRFWQPFRDFRRGHPETLQHMEQDFFRLIGGEGREPLTD